MTSHSTTAEDFAEYLRGGPIGPKIAAVFDFDGTLIEGNSASALYEHRLRRGELGPAELVRVLRSVNSPIMSLPHFTELVESMLHAWAGRTEEEVSQIGDRLFSHSIAGDLFHEA